MTIKSFGTLLIGAGILIMFSLFAFSEWSTDLNFIQNIRYAILFEWEGGNVYTKEHLFLGQGLIAPLIIIGLGLSLKHGIINKKYVIKILPFLDE